MVFLCIVCSYHAVINSVENNSNSGDFHGYSYMTQLEYNSYKKSIANKTTETYYFDPDRNMTMVKIDYLSAAERYDRYALIFFVCVYVTFHIVFILWMYLYVSFLRRLNFEIQCLKLFFFKKVYKRRREMNNLNKKYLVINNFILLLKMKI